MYSLTCDEERVGRWVAKTAGWYWTPSRGTAIGLEKDGNLIAGVVFEDYRGTNCTIHLAGIPRSGWIVNRLFLKAIRDYIYRNLKCTRLTAPVPENKRAFIGMLLRFGWEVEFVQKRGHYGQDLIYFVLWLDKPNVFTRLELHGRRQLSSET